MYDASTLWDYADYAFCSYNAMKEMAVNYEDGSKLQEPHFFVEDAAQLDNVIAEVQNISSINWDNFIITANDEVYQNISSALSDTGTLITTLIVVITAVSMVLIILILSMSIRSRKRETGILLAVGIAKPAVILQYVLETLLIAVVAFPLAYLSSKQVAGTLGTLFGKAAENVIVTPEHFMLVAIVGGILLVAAVLAAAWFAAPHVLDWATHTWYTVVKDRDLEAESASRAEAAASSAAASSAAASQAASEPEPEEEKPLDGKAITGGSWAELDVTTLTDEAAIRAAARQLKQQGADYALVTLKDAAGTVYYASGVAAAAQSITENPVNAANIAAILREEGIIPAAQLAAFTDPVSVYTDRSMGVHYDGNSLWLDNVSAAKGGKAWMNPFAASAVQFVGDLIEEVQGMGYEQVVLTGVQFPNIITRKQDFGASGGKSREGRAAQLTADIAAWQTRFAGSVTLWVSYPDALCTAATDALGTTGTSLGMENLLVTSSTALDADSRAALEQAAADAGVKHVVVHDTAAFR